MGLSLTAAGRLGIVQTKPAKPVPPIAFPDLSTASGVLAIDPSICDCGWAILRGNSVTCERVDSGTWHPSQAVSAGDRWAQLARFVFELSRKSSVRYVVIEAPNKRGLGRQAKFSRASQITYGRAVGTVEASARNAIGEAWTGAVDHVFNPDVEAWKRKSSKSQTSKMVALRLRYTPRDHNEADALGLALWFLDQCRCKS